MNLLFIPVKVVVFAECKTVAVDGSFVVAPTAVVGKYGCDFVAVVMDDNVGTVIPVSKSYYKELMNILVQYKEA